MAVVASATGVALGMTAGTLGAGLVGGAVLGAGIGGIYSAVTGDGDILNSMLTGGLIGGGVGGLGAAAGPTLMGTAGGTTAAGGAAAAAPSLSPALTAAQMTSANAAGLDALAAANGVFPEMAASLPGQGLLAAPASLPATIAPATASNLLNAPLPGNFMTTDASSYGAGYGPKGFEGGPKSGIGGMDMLGYGLAGSAALSLLGGMNQPKISTSTGVTNPSQIRPYTYTSTQNQSAYPTTPQYGPNGMPILPTSEQNYFNQSYTAGTPYTAAEGGLMSSPNVAKSPTPPTPGLMDYAPKVHVDFMGQDMYPQSQMYRDYYSTPTQMPTSAQQAMAAYEPKTNPLTGQTTIGMAVGGITYDAATQRYAGLPSPEPAAPVEQLPADLVASLTPQYQAANPNFFSYDAKNQRYGVGIPTMSQLNVFKAEQDRKAAEEAAAAAAAAYQPSYDGGGGGAAGGLMPYNLGSYSDGGRLLKGPGDGVSDDIPAVIGQKQPARLADGEFVIPARIVSEIGNGSTDAGAKRLYSMMDNIQAGRKKTIGKNNVAKDTKAKKHLLG